MKLRTLGIVTLIVLIAGLLWTLRPRGLQPAPLAPTPAPVAEKQVDAAPLESVATASSVRESAQLAPAPALVIEATTAKDFALIKVLVLNKTTRAPMPDIDVHAIYDTASGGRRIEKTTRSHGKPFEVLHTDADGRVEIEMPPNLFSTVSANGTKHDGGLDQADIPALKPGDVKEIVLQIATGNDMPFWMKFVDETSHAPIAGVRVGAGSDRNPRLTSDTGGLVVWQARTWPPGVLQVDADGYARGYLKPEPGHREPSSAFVVSLLACASLKVHVVDATDQPIVGAKVDLVTKGYSQSASSERSTEFVHIGDPHLQGVTDSSGHVTITCIPAHVAISAGVISPKQWSTTDKLVLEPGEMRELEWKLSNGCHLRGIVLDQSNTPVKQREMWLRTAERKRTVYFNRYGSGGARTAMTDEQGRFHFDDVSAGTWWVGPSNPTDTTKIPDDDVAAVAQVVEIADGQSDLDVTVRVDRGLFIRGTILNSKGEPVKNGTVLANDLENSLSVQSNRSSDNSFALGPLMAGHYVLTAVHHGSDADSEPVDADAGVSNVVLRLRAGASLYGTVIGPSGEPVPARIWVKMRSAKTQNVQGTSCRNDGAFQITGLEAGAYDLSAHTSDGATALLEGVTVESGESKSGLVIHLLPGGHVRVRHEGPDRFINVALLAHGVTVDIAGVERSTSLELASPLGTVTVQATYTQSDKRVLERTVEVKAGETVDVVFEKDAH